MSDFFHSLIRQMRLPAPAKAVALYLACCADDGNPNLPPVSRIAHETGLSERTIRRALRALQNRGVIVVDRAGNGRSVHYWFPLTATPHLPAPGATPSPDGPYGSRAEGVSV